MTLCKQIYDFCLQSVIFVLSKKIFKLEKGKKQKSSKTPLKMLYLSFSEVKPILL